MNISRVYLLTGCASGIGRHLATVLARDDSARLVLTDINLPALEAYAERQDWDPRRVVLRPLDVRDSTGWNEAVSTAVTQFGRLDVLFNIAGYLQPAWMHESTAEHISLHMDINAKGVMFGTHAAARQMIEQGDGHIVNFASIAGVAPVPGISLYSASKFAVRGFSIAVARELRPHNVYVTVVCPDAVQTPMLDLQVDYEQAALTFSGSRPLTVEEIERVVLQRVLARRPLEVTIPFSRGWLAKLASIAPNISGALLGRLRRKGLANQAAAKARRGGETLPAELDELAQPDAGEP